MGKVELWKMFKQEISQKPQKQNKWMILEHLKTSLRPHSAAVQKYCMNLGFPPRVPSRNGTNTAR